MKFNGIYHCVSLHLKSKKMDAPTLLKKLTSKVDGFTFVHFCLKVITSDVKVLYDLLMLYVRRYYLLREVA